MVEENVAVVLLLLLRLSSQFVITTSSLLLSYVHSHVNDALDSLSSSSARFCF